MKATKWHKRSADLFNVEPHVSPRKVRAEPGDKTPSSFGFIPGVMISLSAGQLRDSSGIQFLEVTMTADEADELANRLHTMAKIAREDNPTKETP